MVYHTTVLSGEVIEMSALASRLSLCIDATLGDGGHSLALLERWRRVKVIGIDCDEGMLHRAAERMRYYRKRITMVCDHYDSYLASCRTCCAQFVLFDLGLSMTHLVNSGRGFSFAVDEPLDMRFDTSQTMCAADIVNGFSGDELEHIFHEYSQERYAKQIAVKILAERKRNKIVSTVQLAKIISSAVSRGSGSYKKRDLGSKKRHARNNRSAPIHPATRVFQALRIAVNDELNRLQRALACALQVVESGGVIAVISFHSGEDRIVKQCFRNLAQLSLVAALHKSVVTAKPDEVRCNHAARSAKLRAVRRL